jgi:hypothetical protein
MERIVDVPNLDFSGRMRREFASRQLMKDGKWLVNDRPPLAPAPREYKQPMAVMPAWDLPDLAPSK